MNLKKKHFMETINTLEEALYIAQDVMDEAFGNQEDFFALSQFEKECAKSDCFDAINRRLAKLEEKCD